MSAHSGSGLASKWTEDELITGLGAGDEAAFVAVMDLYGASMLRLAMTFVNGREAAEDVVQETWIAVLTGIERFERRSSLKSWTFAILANQARARGKKDARVVPFASLAATQADGSEAAVDADRFRGPEEQWHGHWNPHPTSWLEQPEEKLMSDEVMRVVSSAIDALPEAQRATILMRDVQAMDAEDVCNALEITDSNQRVLLHRARSKVRRAVEAYLDRE